MILSTITGGMKLIFFGAAGMAAGVVLGQAAPPITNTSTVSLELAVGIAVTGVTSAMWLSGRLTKLADAQQKLSEGQTRLEEGQRRAETRFDNLPCHQWTKPQTCEPGGERKP